MLGSKLGLRFLSRGPRLKNSYIHWNHKLDKIITDRINLAYMVTRAQVLDIRRELRKACKKQPSVAAIRTRIAFFRREAGVGHHPLKRAGKVKKVRVRRAVPKAPKAVKYESSDGKKLKINHKGNHMEASFYCPTCLCRHVVLIKLDCS